MRRELFTAVVGDVMDAAGLTSQFLPPQVRPLRDDMVVVGRAMPVLEADCADTYVAHEGRAEPFGLMFDALDDLRAGEVYVCSGASPRYALWGGLMTTRAMRLGAVGAVVDGYSRDTRDILAMPGFPTFSRGPYAQDQGVRGRVVDYRCAVRFSNGTVVRPGDLIFGDVDGVLIVPRAHEADILAAALKKVRGEKRVRAAIEAGMSARQAYDIYGIM
ncbi:RraA family protein [Jiangella endophytica]|uniref:RraA family protein n=1 Tax=Jiangella endophytica TaxID=1623398 RepID=UPI0038CC0E60